MNQDILLTCAWILTLPKSSLIQQGSLANHSSNILDLCLSTDHSIVNNLTLFLGLSNHLVAHLNLSFPVKYKFPHHKKIKDYNKADYDSIKGRHDRKNQLFFKKSRF